MCMVVFHTIFALSEQLSGQQFLRIFSDWLQDFPDVDLPMPTEDTMESVSADGSARLTSCQTSTYIGLQLSYEKEDVQYQHTYIRTVWHDIPVLYAHVEGSFLSGAKKRPLSWEVPGFVQRLFWEECAGEDHGIPTDDKAWVLRRQQVPLAQDILSRKLELLNPVVYLSPNQQTGEYAFDYERLARKLRGIAHVLVEGSPLVSKEVKQAVPDAPTDGETSVIFPGVEEQRFAFPDEGSQKEIFDQICGYIENLLSDVKVDDTFSFARLQLAYWMERSDQTQLGELCDELLKEKDLELTQLRQERDELSAQLFAAKEKAQTYEASLKKKQETLTETESGIAFVMHERDLYEGERKDAVLRVLQETLDRMTGDPNQEGCRRYHVLKDLLENNAPTGREQEIRDGMDKIFQNELTSRTIPKLEQLGFVVARSGNSHWRLAYGDDDRYAVQMSATPSDWRSAENLESRAANMLFGSSK